MNERAGRHERRAPTSDVPRLGIVGAGTMGAGIAELGCLAGIDTVLVDADPAVLERAVAQIEARLQRAVDRGRIHDMGAARARLSTTDAVSDLNDREIVIEAVPERLAVKHAVIRSLSDTCSTDTVIATNTSSLPVAEIAVAAEHPQRVLGMHFFNPPSAMPLVELVATPLTSAAALERAANTALAMEKRVIRALDGPGFLVNRCARPYYLEALRILDERLAEPEQVDRICRLAGFPMGPFELMDLIGIDVGLEVTRTMYERSGHEPRWRPSPTQERLVADGRLGRKAGHGFYDYTGPQPERGEGAPTPGTDRDRPVAIVGDDQLAHDLRARAAAAGFAVREQANLTVVTDSAPRTVASGPVLWACPGAPPPPGAHAVDLLPPLDEVRVAELADGADGDSVTFLQTLGLAVERPANMLLGRIAAQLINEAAFAVEAGIGTAADVDAGLRLGLRFPRGPLEWGDAIGPERVVAILDHLARVVPDGRYRAAPLLRRAATEGRSLTSPAGVPQAPASA